MVHGKGLNSLLQMPLFPTGIPEYLTQKQATILIHVAHFHFQVKMYLIVAKITKPHYSLLYMALLRHLYSFHGLKACSYIIMLFICLTVY